MMILYQMRAPKMSSMELIKKLRDITGSGIVDCKKALSENNNDIEASVKWLREKGILKAQKKNKLSEFLMVIYFRAAKMNINDEDLVSPFLKVSS